MTTIINASPTNGLVQTADGSGVIKVQSNGVTTNALAWVNFDGTGTVAIRSSYNVSSITDNGTGDYTVNFTTALSDINYSVTANCSDTGTYGGLTVNVNSTASNTVQAPTTTTTRIAVVQPNVGTLDTTYICVSVFGN